ncbi:hypothetical protein [Pseudomonas phage vB_Pae_SG_WM_Sew_P27]
MNLEHRIRRWLLQAERRGKPIHAILIHPDDIQSARKICRFAPVKVLGIEVRRYGATGSAADL